MTTLFGDGSTTTRMLALRGLEADNLLSFLALLGLLRAIEESQPGWAPRVFWAPSPWRASLHLDADADEARVAEAADEGVRAVIERLVEKGPTDDHHDLLSDVSFERDAYRKYALDARHDTDAAGLAACLACAWPPKKDGAVPAGPLVMMFGQGHQHFLDRYLAVPRADGGERAIAKALFAPWKRASEADGFRWDPDDDQRYALRFGNPSKAGAAPTEDGANRLATLGFLSFPSAPASRRVSTRGCVRGGEVAFVWPIWRTSLSRAGIESLLSHPSVMSGRLESVRALGVDEIYRARRVSNGKFMNVTRALPVVVRSSKDHIA